MLVMLACMLAAAVYASVQAARAERRYIQAIYAGNALRAAPDLPAPRAQELQEELVRLVQEGLAINPHYRQLASVSADTLMRLGNESEALRVWERVVTSRPNIAHIWANMAMV
jgi:hypothetical protein